MSLKDLEMRHPQAGEQPTSATTDSFESVQKDELNDCSTAEDSKSSVATAFVSVDDLKPVKTESTSTTLPCHDSAPQHPSPDTSFSSGGLVFDTPPSAIETPSTETSARSDTTPTSVASDADVSSNTKATLTVVRNPAGHIMEGLMRRWDLNFFRNSR